MCTCRNVLQLQVMPFFLSMYSRLLTANSVSWQVIGLSVTRSNGNSVASGMYAKSEPFVDQLGRQLPSVSAYFRYNIDWKEVPILRLN